MKHAAEIDKHRARMAEIEVAEMEAKESDRLARPGIHREFTIDEPLMPDTVGAYINVLEHWERRDPGQPITIRVNSPGGSVTDGFALFDTILRLRRKGHKITMVGQGMVASMATVLLQAGDERILDKNAWFMIHEGSAGMQGKSRDMRATMRFMDQLEDRILDILAERSKLNKRQIQQRWKDNSEDYMTADEALKLGFVDRVE